MPRTLINLTLDWGLDPDAGMRRVRAEIGGATIGEGEGTQPQMAPGKYHWSFLSSNPASIDSFELQARLPGPEGHGFYDVVSTSQHSNLAQLVDGSIQLTGGFCVSGECSTGHFEIKEPFTDQIKDGLGLGRSRTFHLLGHPQGEIRFNSSPGINAIELEFEAATDSNQDLNAVLVAAVLLLYKGITHYD